IRARRLQRKREVLGQMPLFRPLDDRELRRVLQVTEVRSYTDGQVIIEEGDAGDSLYIVLSGKASVYHNNVLVKPLGTGEHLGARALARSHRRSATVRSGGSSEMLILRRAEFFEIMRSQPRIAVKLLWQFTSVLAERLADTTRDLGEARVELEEPVPVITEELFMIEDNDAHDRQTVEVPEAAELDVSEATEDK